MKKSIIKYLALGIGGLLGLSFIFGASLSNQFASKEESFYTALAYEGTPLPTSGTLSSGTYYLSGNLTVSSQLKITSGNVIVNLNGHTLNGGGRDKGIFHVTGGTLTVNGKDDETGNRGALNDGGGYYPGDYSYGGALYIVGGGATFNDLDITNCQANYGGAIYMKNSAVTLNNCSLSHNTDDIAWGGHGAITVGDSSAAGTGLTVNGGEIFSNESGIRLAGKAKATINGAYIHGNDKHGVRVETNEGEGGLTISGDTIIKDNNPSSGNLLLNNNNVAKVRIASELGDDAYIGVTIAGDTKGVFTNSIDTSLNDASKFFSDDSNYGVMKNDDGQLMLTEIVATIKNGSDITNYDSIEPALSNWVNGSTLTLLRDVVTSSTITVNNTRTLDLNGCGFRASNTGFSIFNIGISGDLTVNDSDPKHAHKVTLSNYIATGVSNGAGEDSVNDDGSGTAYINGGYVAGGFKGLNGGAFYVSGGTLTLNGGTLIGNKSDGNGCSGGAIYLESNGYFKMNGGSIKYNYSGNAGAGIAAHQSTIEINGGVISFNRNNWSGGGAMSLNNGSTLKLYGGVIENNVSRHAEGAISFKAANQYLYIKGSPIVRNNTSANAGYGVNLLLNNGVVAQIEGPLTEKADIRLCCAGTDSRVVTDGWSTYMAGKNPTDYFFSDNPNYSVYLKDGEAYYGVDVAKVQNGETITYYENFSDALAAWTENTTLTLLKDITVNEATTVDTTKTIDLNGYGIRQTGNYRIFKVTSTGNLTIIDSDPAHAHAITLSNYRGTSVADGTGTTSVTDGTGTAYITGGYLTGGNVTSNADGIEGACLLVNGGIIDLEGGTIIGNYLNVTNCAGSGVGVINGGTFRMHDGAITYNYSANSAAGIETISSYVEIYNGTISHNKNNNCGGAAISVTGTGSLKLYGGRIEGNVAKSAAGVVDLYRYSPQSAQYFGIKGSPVVLDNSALGSGSAVNVRLYEKINIDGELTEGAKIGVSLQGTGNGADWTSGRGVFTTGWSTYMEGKDPADYFVSDNPDYTIYMRNGEAYCGYEPNVAITNGTTVDKYDNLADAVNAWTDGTTLTLLKDITISDTINVNNKVTLDLNGYGIKATGTDYSVLTINNGGKLTIIDSGDTTQYFTVADRYPGNGAGFATVCDKATYDAADENLRGTFQGGYITGGNITSTEFYQSKAGAITVMTGGELDFKAGTIIGNSGGTESPGGVSSFGTFTLNGGNIIYNRGRRGSGVFLNGGAFVMNSGSIEYNTGVGAGEYGTAALHSYGDTESISLKGGSISHNYTKYGGIATPINIFLSGDFVAVDNIACGSSGNEAANGNIRLTEGSLISGCITGNTPIGITLGSGSGVFTNNTDTSLNDPSKFVSDNPDYAIGVYPAGHAKAGQLFIGNKVTVTYNNNGHGTAPDSETVASGSLITEPTAPTAEGWNFGGWYKDEECTDKWNFGTDTITANRTLYAGWQVPYEIIPPTAITGLDYTANNQNLINAGSATYGELLYAVNTTGELPNESEFTSSIPTGNLVGKYYVFYMATGDADHYPTQPSLDNKVEATIARVDRSKVTALNEEVIEFLNTIKEDSRYTPLYTALEATRSEVEVDAIDEDNVTAEDVEENYLKLKEAFEYHTQTVNTIKLINDIGDLTYDGGVNDSLNDIIKARTAYDNLKPEQKDIVDNINKDVLDHDMIVYKHVDKAGDLIKGIPTPNASDEYYDAVDFAKAEYDKLTDEEKEVLNTDYNFDYIKAIADNQKAIEVIKVIDEIGDVTYNPGNDDSLDDIKNAEEIYNSLTDEQKALVDLANHDELQQSRDTYDKVDDTVKKIDSIGDITHGGEDDSKEDINKAREIYDSLTPEQKALVNGYKDSYVTLDDAEHVYDVLEKIDAIGEVGFDTASEEAIEEAKKYYSSLTEEQKAKVKEDKKIILVQAEQAYDEKKQSANILLIILLIIASLLLLSGIIVLIILIKKRNKEDDNNDNNKKTTVKVASFAGLTPMIFMSHYLDTPFILLYIISGLALLAWIAVIIVAIFYKRHKKQQAIEEAPQQNKQVEAVQSSEDEEEVVTITDEKGNIFNIRYIKSFTAKLIQSSDETKAYYEELKNYVLSYKKTNSRVSWHYDSVNSGRNQVLKFAIRGKTLCIYLPLNPNDYADSKYKVETVDSKKYEEVPCLYRIKNDRRRDYAKDLIDVVMTNLGLVKGEEQHNSYYLHYEENKPLIIRGLIKELKVQVNKPVIRETQILSVVTNEEGEEVITKQDSKGNIFQIRYIKSFTAKLIQANDESKHYYEELKNYVLSYKKTNSRMSWHYDSVNSGRNQVLKFAIRGKTLCVYYPLNADDYNETKYKVEKVESKKFEEVPCLYRIKNDRRCEYAKDLIDTVMNNLGLAKGEEKHEVYSNLPYEPNKPLIARGLIKELEVQINKPVIRETQVLKVVTNEDGDEVITKQDSKGNIFQIRYIKSFTAKLSQSADEVKDYYNELKNYALSYKKANSRISWHYDSINVGRNQVLKFSIRGKTLCLYYALDANNYADSKYKVEAVESKKYEDVPCLYRIKNDRRRDYAKELIDVVMNNVPTELGKQSDEDFRIPYEETNALLAKGLIKELKVKIDNPEPVNKTISVHEVDEKMSDEIAESKIEEDTTSKKHVGKKGIINIDTIGDNFYDGDVVDIETLWKKKLVSSNVGYVKVLARGSLNKRLTINLQDYSLQAVKMVLLAGGKVKKAK